DAEPTEAIIAAEGMGWPRLIRVLLGMVRGYRGQLVATFLLGVARVLALIGVGVLSALVVRAVKSGAPVGRLLAALLVVAPLAGILHWVESWLAHDMAYRLLADMRLDMFRKLDALAPAYLTRRRTGDLVGAATHDIELIEYFFAHTITPAFVAILVPAGVMITLGAFGWPLAIVLLPFLAYAGLTPVLARARIDRLGSRAPRPAAGARARGGGGPIGPPRPPPAPGGRASPARPGGGAGGARRPPRAPATISRCGCRTSATSRSRARARRWLPASAASPS